MPPGSLDPLATYIDGNGTYWREQWSQERSLLLSKDASLEASSLFQVPHRMFDSARCYAEAEHPLATKRQDIVVSWDRDGDSRPDLALAREHFEVLYQADRERIGPAT